MPVLMSYHPMKVALISGRHWILLAAVAWAISSLGFMHKKNSSVWYELHHPGSISCVKTTSTACHKVQQAHSYGSHSRLLGSVWDERYSISSTIWMHVLILFHCMAKCHCKCFYFQWSQHWGAGHELFKNTFLPTNHAMFKFLFPDNRSERQAERLLCAWIGYAAVLVSHFLELLIITSQRRFHTFLNRLAGTNDTPSNSVRVLLSGLLCCMKCRRWRSRGREVNGTQNKAEKIHNKPKWGGSF